MFFGLFGNNSAVANVASGATGALTGAFLMNLINKYSMSKKDKKISTYIERLGGDISDDDLRRSINKVTILQTMAYRDSILCEHEKVHIINYIVDNRYLPTDLKISIIKELDNKIEINMLEFLEQFKSNIRFKNTFNNQEEKDGFASTLKKLITIDGQVDEKEKNYFKMICKACDLPYSEIETAKD